MKKNIKIIFALVVLFLLSFFVSAQSSEQISENESSSGLYDFEEDSSSGIDAEDNSSIVNNEDSAESITSENESDKLKYLFEDSDSEKEDYIYTDYSSLPESESTEGDNTEETASEDDIINPVEKLIKENSDSNEKKSGYKKAEKKYPGPRRPKKYSEEEIEESLDKTEKNAGDEYIKKTQEAFLYGLEDEITGLIDELTKNKDLRFVDTIYDLFESNTTPALRIKIIEYFTELKDPCLSDYAVGIINDPYDEKKDIVNACFKYIEACEIKDAVPGVIDLIEKEDEDYFTQALSCIGVIGGSEEAGFLTDYLDRTDFSNTQKQSLMKVLGKIKAISTYDKIAEVAQDKDENSFVRGYAAEAIGAMGKDEAKDILIKLYSEDDPNFRQYVIKGLSYFDDEDSNAVIIQALRDKQWKIRDEAINSVESKKLKQAVPYLIYRCKDKTEQGVIKDKCYKVLGKLNTTEGNDFLVSIITDKKAADSTKGKVAAVLLENNNAGTKEILDLAESTLKDDIHKSLRYTLGKEFAKYGRQEFENICSLYIASKDTATQGTGLDIYAKGRYLGVRASVEEIAKDAFIEEKKEKEDDTSKAVYSSTKKNANSKKAKKILEMIDPNYDFEESFK